MVSVSVRQNPAWAIPDMPRPANRHRSGDTFLIGGKPHDPLDPGPWLWRPDPSYQRDLRTGRHRRGELPDPVRPIRRPLPFPRLVDSPGTVDSRDSHPGAFGALREDAWARFLLHSAELAEAHRQPRRSGPSGLAAPSSLGGKDVQSSTRTPTGRLRRSVTRALSRLREFLYA